MCLEKYFKVNKFLAAPVIETALKKADEQSHFVYVTVGDRPT